MANEYASIPAPTADNLLPAVDALKQTVEALVGQRGTSASTAVTQAALAAQANLAGVTPSVAIANLGIGAGGANAMFAVANNLSEGVAATIRTNIAAATNTQTDFISGIIKSAANQDYRVIEKIPYGVTLTSFVGKTSSGTLTATLKINTTAVTNGALSVTSTQGAATPSALNVLVSTDTLVVTVSSISSPVDFSFVIVFTRVLA